MRDRVWHRRGGAQRRDPARTRRNPPGNLRQEASLRAGRGAPGLPEGGDAVVWTFEGWTILPAICYDLRFAYHFWERAAATDLVLVPANWPGSRREHWRSLLQARAIENQVPVAGCNRVGRDATLAYSGDSLVFDAQGRILADAGEAEGVLTCVVERERTAETRRRFPFLGDRLP